MLTPLAQSLPIDDVLNAMRLTSTAKQAGIVGPALCVFAFVCGSVPFSLLLGLLKGVDIRSVGSGNVGATNLGRALGRPWFFAGFALDMLKGLTPVLVACALLGTLARWEAPIWATSWVLACVVCTVAGHIWSPWIGFKGGKGVATGFGAMLGVFPMLTFAALGALLVFLVVLRLYRFISLASIAACCSIPLFVLVLAARADGWQTRSILQGSSGLMFWTSLAIAVVVVWKHRSNVQRLRAGTEPTIKMRPLRLSTMLGA